MAAGISGNPNLLIIRRHHFVTMDGTSDQTIALAPGTKYVTLYATAAAWVAFGTDPTAAAVNEKTAGAANAFYLPATTFLDVALPVDGTVAAPIKVAAIQGGSGGNLHVYERSEV